MAVQSVFSGIVQMAQPSVSNELFQAITGGAESARGADMQDSLLDEASPIALPAVPTTEAPYDGLVCFGTFVTDVALDG